MTQMQAGQGGGGQGPSPGGGQGVPTFSFKPMEEPWTGATKADDKTMGLLCHILGWLTSFVGPLILWVVKKDDSKFVEANAKEALNFQLSLIILWFLGVATSCIGVGFVILAAAWVVDIVFSIIAAMKANNMIVYRYPLAIRLIK